MCMDFVLFLWQTNRLLLEILSEVLFKMCCLYLGIMTVLTLTYFQNIFHPNSFFLLFVLHFWILKWLVPLLLGFLSLSAMFAVNIDCIVLLSTWQYTDYFRSYQFNVCMSSIYEILPENDCVHILLLCRILHLLLLTACFYLTIR